MDDLPLAVGDLSPSRFYWGWMPLHPAFLVRRAIYQTYGDFELELGSAADYELILRFLLKHRIMAAYIVEALACMSTRGMSKCQPQESHPGEPYRPEGLEPRRPVEESGSRQGPV